MIVKEFSVLNAAGVATIAKGYGHASQLAANALKEGEAAVIVIRVTKEDKL